jgi:putative phosphoribosyl transferase
MTAQRPPSVRLREGPDLFEGVLDVPTEATGIVVFAHAGAGSRRSRRNTEVASSLRRAGIGTFLIDLLTDDEASDVESGFDIALLTRRLLSASRWLETQPPARSRALGYFGASTGSAAALEAAAALGPRVAAVVSCGGRPDLVGKTLGQVRAPTLLIVGGHDQEAIELNRAAGARLDAPHQLSVIHGATHLFEEQGALEQVASLTGDWFARYFQPRSSLTTG